MMKYYNFPYEHLILHYVWNIVHKTDSNFLHNNKNKKKN